MNISDPYWHNDFGTSVHFTHIDCTTISHLHWTVGGEKNVTGAPSLLNLEKDDFLQLQAPCKKDRTNAKFTINVDHRESKPQVN